MYLARVCLCNVNTGAKLIRITVFADFERALVQILVEITDFGAFRPKFALKKSVEMQNISRIFANVWFSERAG